MTMVSWSRAWVALVLVAACSTPSSTKSDGANGDAAPTCSIPASILPADSAVGDYTLSGAATQVDSAQQLYDLIDGGADRHLSAGFVCLRSGRYSSPGGLADIAVSIYDQGTTSGATAVYSAYSTSGQRPLTPTLGDASTEDTSLPLNYRAFMRIGRFFVDIIADSPQGRTSTIAMLEAVLANIKK
jgi:hypothetical protein